MKRVVTLIILGLCVGCAQIAVVPAYNGIVRDAKSGAVILGATVLAMHLQRQEWRTTVISDSKGEFHLPAFKIWKATSSESFPKAVMIRVTKVGYAPFEKIVSSDEEIVVGLYKSEPN
jgi:hypothetical protein